jgi:hypothetical protein
MTGFDMTRFERARLQPRRKASFKKWALAPEVRVPHLIAASDCIDELLTQETTTSKFLTPKACSPSHCNSPPNPISWTEDTAL